MHKIRALLIVIGLCVLGVLIYLNLSAMGATCKLENALTYKKVIERKGEGCLIREPEDDKEIIDICSTYFTCPKTEDCLKCPIREEDFEENPAEEQQAAMQDCWNDNSAKKDEIEKLKKDKEGFNGEILNLLKKNTDLSKTIKAYEDTCINIK